MASAAAPGRLAAAGPVPRRLALLVTRPSSPYIQEMEGQGYQLRRRLPLLSGRRPHGPLESR